MKLTARLFNHGVSTIEAKAMVLSEQAFKKIDRELAKFPADQRQSAVMAALAIAQDETGWVSLQ